MSERPAGTPSCAAILVYEPYGPQIDHRFFHSSFRLRTAHVVIYPFAGQGVPRICVFSYRIWLVMYMKVWPSTVGSISEKLIHSNVLRCSCLYSKFRFEDASFYRTVWQPMW